MDPLTIGLQAVGLGLQLFGAAGAADKAKEAASINKQMAGDEQDINAQKRLQMEMSARRMQMETLRNAQRARAQATAAAVNQGANMGTGLQGGLAQISDDANTNLFGINSNLKIGENIFDINNKISGEKMQLADVQAQQATDQSFMSLGGSLVQNAGTIGNIGKFFGGKISGTA